MPDVILVTGGTGLVGAGIRYIIENEPEGSRFGKRAGETWVFASSSEADLRFVVVQTLLKYMDVDLDGSDLEQTKKLFAKYKPTHVIHLAALGMSFAKLIMTAAHNHIWCSRWTVQEHEVQGQRTRFTRTSYH